MEFMIISEYVLMILTFCYTKNIKQCKESLQSGDSPYQKVYTLSIIMSI